MIMIMVNVMILRTNVITCKLGKPSFQLPASPGGIVSLAPATYSALRWELIWQTTKIENIDAYGGK